jgi:predicted phage terminase large subunit-like protein
LYDVQLELARRDLSEYFELARGFRPAPHQRIILDELKVFLRGCWDSPPGEHTTLRVLNINLPPGAGKSSIISATLPAWVLGNRPWERVGIISAQGTLSGLFENTIKGDIETGEVFRECFPSWEARPDKTRGWAKGTLYLQGLPRSEATPSLVAAGLFGSVIGRRFTMLILDDPQDQMTTRTPDQREMSWNFLDATVLSRVIPGSPVICVQQRWHEDDISGRLQRLYGAKVVKVRAVNERDESYWPEMYSREYLDQRRLSEPHMFQANYQQEPGMGDGGVFRREWFKYYDVSVEGEFVHSKDPTKRFRPEHGWRYQSYDTAFKKGDSNDYTAFVEAVVNPVNNDVYVTDVWWERLEFPDLVARAKQAFEARVPRSVLVEDKASGTSLVQVLQKQTGVPLVPIKVETDKVNRARGTTGYLEAGKVHFPRHHPKVAEFESFLTGFPFMTHDDPVDAFSQLMSYVITKAGHIDYAIG